MSRMKLARKEANGTVTQTSPRLDEEIARRQKARRGPATEADAPPPSTFPGPKPVIHEGQLQIEDAR